MTSPPQHSEVAVAADVVPRALVLAIVAGTILLSVLLCGVAYVLFRVREHQLGTASLVVPPAPPHEALFELTPPAPPAVEHARRSLSETRWVDRRRGLVQIPIEQAMDVLVRARNAQSEAPR